MPLGSSGSPREIDGSLGLASPPALTARPETVGIGVMIHASGRNLFSRKFYRKLLYEIKQVKVDAIGS